MPSYLGIVVVAVALVVTLSEVSHAADLDAFRPRTQPTQKIVIVVERFRVGGCERESWCKVECSGVGNVPVEEYMRDGWRIVAALPKSVLIKPWSDLGDAMNCFGCECFGTQYVLQRD